MPESELFYTVFPAPPRIFQKSRCRNRSASVYYVLGFLNDQVPSRKGGRRRSLFTVCGLPKPFVAAGFSRAAIACSPVYSCRIWKSKPAARKGASTKTISAACSFDEKGTSDGHTTPARWG